jgi:hypothetical protein
MHFSAVNKVFWAAGLAMDIALFLVMVFRGRWRRFPILTIWITLLTIRAVALMVVYDHGSKYWYTWIYAVGYSFDFALQLGLVVEIARIVLRPTGTWIRDARLPFVVGGTAGAAVAVLFAWWVSPPNPSAVSLWVTRVNLFTSLVICELFVLMMVTANRFGLGWRNHVMAIGQGLTAWSSLMVLKTSIQSLPGTGHYFSLLNELGNVTYLAAIGWIILQLWRDEPERRPISPDLSEYILALHRRVEYDLRRLDAPQ